MGEEERWGERRWTYLEQGGDGLGDNLVEVAELHIVALDDIDVGDLETLE